jgi:hypothetical protein
MRGVPQVGRVSGGARRGAHPEWGAPHGGRVYPSPAASGIAFGNGMVRTRMV